MYRWCMLMKLSPCFQNWLSILISLKNRRVLVVSQQHFTACMSTCVHSRCCFYFCYYCFPFILTRQGSSCNSKVYFLPLLFFIFNFPNFPINHPILFLVSYIILYSPVARKTKQPSKKMRLIPPAVPPGHPSQALFFQEDVVLLV